MEHQVQQQPGDIPAAVTESDTTPVAPSAVATETSTESAAEASGSTVPIPPTSPSTEVRVFNPAPTPEAVSTPAEVNDEFFESSLADVQAQHASVLARSKRLNEAPLLTSKYRDEEREAKEKRKAEKWPNTTIRIKFSDGTQVQSVFPSSSPIQPVYAFVRACLDPSSSSKPFVLWQPPRYTYPETPSPAAAGKKPNPHRTHIVTPANYGPVKGGQTAGLMNGTGGKESLGDLGLVPQSVLMVRWEDDEMNATGYPAPLLPELRQKAEPLPPPQSAGAASNNEAGSVKPPAPDGPKEKKIPKWLQKGLMKKK